MAQHEPRIVPWRHKSDLDELKRAFYPKKFGTADRRREAVVKVRCWNTRGPYVPHTVESTAHLAETKMLDEQALLSGIPLQLSYTMAMIRFVNGLLDPTQQSQFAIPLHTLAERMGLPSWFVELRHCGTHERELPSLDMLRLASESALEWLWEHYWDADEEPAQEEEEQEQTPDVSAETVERVLRKASSIANLLTANGNMWKTQRVSSSFTGEQDPQQKRQKRAEKPEERLERFVLAAKDAWRSVKARPDVFVGALMRNYRSRQGPVLELLADRIQPFGFELCHWACENYDAAIKQGHSPLRARFDAARLRALLSQVCDTTLDLKKVLAHWDRWAEMLRAHPNYVALKLLEGCEQQLQNAADKLRKRHAREVDELRALAQRLRACVVSSELNMYQLAQPQPQDASPAESAPTVPQAQPVPSANDILNDLAQLKKTAQHRRAIRAWDPAPDWTPRPFGTV
ncbi:rRNA-processing protein las1 [Lachancea thermotolerans]